MKIQMIILLILAAFHSAEVFAHPVSYQGATSVMSYNKDQENELLVTYSFKSYFAAALEYYKVEKVTYTVPRLDFLLKRWNNEDSQGNIYLSGGYGTERSFDEQVGVGFASAEADWESRKYYTSLQYNRFFRKDTANADRTDFEDTKLRAGVAPYLADFNEINTWLILEAEKMNDKSVQLTQYVRLFYKNVLIEVGAGFDGGWAFNYMVHF